MKHAEKRKKYCIREISDGTPHATLCGRPHETSHGKPHEYLSGTFHGVHREPLQGKPHFLHKTDEQFHSKQICPYIAIGGDYLMLWISKEHEGERT